MLELDLGLDYFQEGYQDSLLGGINQFLDDEHREELANDFYNVTELQASTSNQLSYPLPPCGDAEMATLTSSMTGMKLGHANTNDFREVFGLDIDDIIMKSIDGSHSKQAAPAEPKLQELTNNDNYYTNADSVKKEWEKELYEISPKEEALDELRYLNLAIQPVQQVPIIENVETTAPITIKCDINQSDDDSKSDDEEDPSDEDYTPTPSPTRGKRGPRKSSPKSSRASPSLSPRIRGRKLSTRSTSSMDCGPTELGRTKSGKPRREKPLLYKFILNALLFCPLEQQDMVVWDGFETNFYIDFEVAAKKWAVVKNRQKKAILPAKNLERTIRDYYPQNTKKNVPCFEKVQGVTHCYKVLDGALTHLHPEIRDDLPNIIARCVEKYSESTRRSHGIRRGAH